MKKRLLALVAILGLIGSDALGSNHSQYLRGRYILPAMIALGGGYYQFGVRRPVQIKYEKDLIKQNALQKVYLANFYFNFLNTLPVNNQFKQPHNNNLYQKDAANSIKTQLDYAVNLPGLYEKQNHFAKELAKLIIKNTSNMYNTPSISNFSTAYELSTQLESALQAYLSPIMYTKAYLVAINTALNENNISVEYKANLVNSAKTQIEDLRDEDYGGTWSGLINIFRAVNWNKLTQSAATLRNTLQPPNHNTFKPNGLANATQTINELIQIL